MGSFNGGGVEPTYTPGGGGGVGGVGGGGVGGGGGLPISSIYICVAPECPSF